MINSITNEGLDKMNSVFGKTQYDTDINTGVLIHLYNKWSQGNWSPHLGMSAVYLMGKIDGIRQERARRKNKESINITIGTRIFSLKKI